MCLPLAPDSFSGVWAEWGLFVMSRGTAALLINIARSGDQFFCFHVVSYARGRVQSVSRKIRRKYVASFVRPYFVFFWVR
jgi:hypothetical protein